ncbi:acetyltransferase, GNAT family protein [Histomonas meleagridis]|uniref:acetyltransferase, GNAT family protein n=1 Tax=Histomonas meleagridis TaxID=135588 RepID=UPI00355938ED|nr:acetyltransferase, GNAT family protein [Histomonas meleagridis]KAH0803306.1 acetyltransferase, GNAT family protein [Histomonas meleagridis]
MVLQNADHFIFSKKKYMLRHLSIRKARPSDGEFATLCVRKLTKLAEGFKVLPEIKNINKCWDSIMNDKKSIAFVAEDNGNPVGIGVCSFNYELHRGGEVCVLQDLFVDDAARKTGAGKKLLSHVEKYAKNHGMVSVDLNQPPPGSAYDDIRSRFYQKNGYETVGMGRTKQFYKIWSIPEDGDNVNDNKL